MPHHTFLDGDDVVQNALLISQGTTLDDIKGLDEIRTRLRSHACHGSAKAMRFHVHYAEPKPAPPAPKTEVVEGIAALLEYHRNPRPRYSR